MAEARRVSSRRWPAARLGLALLGSALAAASIGFSAHADTLGSEAGTGQYVDPATGYLLDSSTGDYVDPNTGTLYTIDQSTGSMEPAGYPANIPAGAQIQVEDPGTLSIGQGYGSSCATGATGSSPCGFAYSAGSELISLGSSGNVSLYQDNSWQAKTLDEIALIIATPNNAPFDGSVSNPVLYQPYYSSNGDDKSFDAGGYVGQFAGGTDLYDFVLGKIGYATGTGDNTTTISKMTAAANAVNNQDGLGLGNITSFGVYVYSISTSIFGSNDLINILTSNLPTGSIVLAAGDTATCTRWWNGSCWNYDVTYFTTPLSQGGIVSYMLPEPGSLALLGSALAGLGLFGWCRRRREDECESGEGAAGTAL